MTGARNVDSSKQPLAAVVESLSDGTTGRAGLLIPQVARRLVREFNRDAAESVFDTTNDALLIDLPLRNLILESRVVQRLCYGLEEVTVPDYAKERAPENDLLLLDPIRLSACINERLNSVGRQLLMKCFTSDIWVMFFKMVSLGIGEKVRAIYSGAIEAVVEDSFFATLEELQLELVAITSRFTNCSPRGYTIEDIENIILEGCREALIKAERIILEWKSEVHGPSTIIEKLIEFLSQSIATVQDIIAPAEVSNEEQHLEGQINVPLMRDTCKKIIAFSASVASELSVLKLQLLEKRHHHFQNAGSFQPLTAEVFRKGIQTSGFSQDEILPLMMLSHCLEAYGTREWCIRFIVEQLKPQLSKFMQEEASQEDRLLRQSQSPFFRTAGAIIPIVEDYFFILPRELLDYMYQLHREAD